MTTTQSTLWDTNPVLYVARYYARTLRRIARGW